MKTNCFVLAAVLSLAFGQCAHSQNTIGVGVPTGATRNDTYIAAGFEFYAPAGVGTTINSLGYWDANGTGLLAPHTVSIYKYDSAFNPSGYQLVVSATVPAGTNATLVNGYRWVGIPTTSLPDNGQGGGYYAIMADDTEDTWANSIGTAPYLNPSIGKISGQGTMNPGNPYTVLSSLAIINGTGNPNNGFGGPNLAMLNPAVPAGPAAKPIIWDSVGVFTNDSVLALAGSPADEVYGVDFGGSNLQTTTNGYTFDDFANTGNMTLYGNLSAYDSYLSGGGTTGDPSFDTVLTYGIYGNSDITAVLNNLTVGQTYNVLAVAADTRGTSGVKFGITDELSTSPSQAFTFPGGVPDVGGYILGTFTAQAASQVFTVVGQVQYNAILLEKAPVIAIQLISNTAPATASAGEGGTVTFSAAFSNNPAITVQWQELSGNPTITNNITAGVVTVTNAGVVGSTLTLTNLAVTNSGSYRLEAIEVADSTKVAFSSPAVLTVIPTITWYAPGTYNGAFSGDTVLTYAGAPANEVYGVDFGGSGFQVTTNGYTFDDYQTTGNMSIVQSGLGSYGNWLNGATTGDPAFDNVLTYGVYGSTDNTATLNNLTIGQSYTVLVMLVDARGAAAGGTTFHVTDGVTQSPEQQYAYPAGSADVAGYIIGTFTAQSTTQPLSVQCNNGNGYYNSQFNAILIETGIAPPPPIAPILATNLAPLASEVPVGAAMSFSIGVSGSAPLHYQWFNANSPIAGATNAVYPFSALAGSNSYFVIVSNTTGAVTSSVAVVTGETNAPLLITFADTTWVFNDNGFIFPSFSDDVLTVTDGSGGESDATIYGTGQYIGGFFASFVYQTTGGADGMAFCVEDSSAGTNALGSAGGGLGYMGITPSVAFEINIYSQSHGGAGIRIDTNGSVGAGFSNSGYSGTGSVDITNGDNIYIELYYMQGVLHVTMTDPIASTVFTTNAIINIPAVVGNGAAYVALTGADGGVPSLQTVSNFVYSSTTPPVLAISHGAPGSVIVSWPISVSTLFTLEQSASVTGPWSPVTQPPVQAGLQNQVTVAAGGGEVFYKLMLVDPNAP